MPAGTQPNERVVLTGAGMPRLRSQEAGDMIAHIEVVVPTELRPEEREALEGLRDGHAHSASVASEDAGHNESFFGRMRGRFRR